MIPRDDALRLILAHVRPLKVERKALAEALGWPLAEEIRADRDMPAADRSAMDGFAVRAADVAKAPATLRLIGEVAAGSANRPRVRAGTCARVLTGANVPPGADAVVMVETTETRNADVTFLESVPSGANIRCRGEEGRKGCLLLGKSTRLAAAQIGVCAAVGKARVKVRREPRVLILCTGEELRDVSERVAPHEIRNSNGPALAAALSQWGYRKVVSRISPDNLAALTARLRRAVARYDVTLLTGGVSVGKYDFVREAVGRIGATVRIHGVAVKPGKPLLYATLAGNRHIFGLPGNPLSVLAGFHVFVLPALLRMSGAAAEQTCLSMRVPLAAPVASKGKRMRFLPARLLWTDRGPMAEPIRSQGSGDIASGGRADGTVTVPLGVREIPAGSLVEFRPWRPLP